MLIFYQPCTTTQDSNIRLVPKYPWIWRRQEQVSGGGDFNIHPHRVPWGANGFILWHWFYLAYNKEQICNPTNKVILYTAIEDLYWQNKHSEWTPLNDLLLPPLLVDVYILDSQAYETDIIKILSAKTANFGRADVKAAEAVVDMVEVYRWGWRAVGFFTPPPPTKM